MKYCKITKDEPVFCINTEVVIHVESYTINDDDSFLLFSICG